MVIPNIPNAIKAIGKVVEAVVEGEPVLVSDKVLSDRLGTCEGVPGVSTRCEFFEPEARQCLACTCFVDIKANLSTESCPKSKWKE